MSNVHTVSTHLRHWHHTTLQHSCQIFVLSVLSPDVDQRTDHWVSIEPSNCTESVSCIQKKIPAESRASFNSTERRCPRRIHYSGVKKEKNLVDIQRRGQVNSHLGWVRLFCFSPCGFGSSRPRARDCLFWQSVCPGLAVSLTEYAVALSTTTSHQSEMLEKISRGVNRKISAWFFFYSARRGTTLWILNNFTIQMRSESP